MVQNAGAKRALLQNVYLTNGRPPPRPRGGGAGAAVADLECRGGTYDRAGVDVIRAALAVLHLQADSGVIVWNTNRKEFRERRRSAAVLHAA